jgi:hypothetical protein
MSVLRRAIRTEVSEVTGIAAQGTAHCVTQEGIEPLPQQSLHVFALESV